MMNAVTDLEQRAAMLWQQVDMLTEAGQLRRLSGTFARFVGALAPKPATPATLLACVLLSELEGRGHSCLMLADLVADPAQLMGWSQAQWQALFEVCGALPNSVAAWQTLLAQAPQIWCRTDLDFEQPLVLDGERLYLRRYWRDEMRLARIILARANDNANPASIARSTLDVARVRHWLDILFAPAPSAASNGVAAAPDWQKIACAIALRGAVTIITGGPGTGKTYTVASLLTLMLAMADEPARLRIALAAPTGKAAARLKQSIDQALASLAVKVGSALPLAQLAQRVGAARTLHSLLGARPDTRAFLHHAGNLLDVDVLIVDEASMVHLEMMAALLEALAPQAILILLGDKDQLASVEAGAVLGDLCFDAQAGGYSAQTVAYVADACAETIPGQYAGSAGALAQHTVMLRQSRRFGGPIGALASAVNAGAARDAITCLRSAAAANDSSIFWYEAAQQSQLLQLALRGRDGAGGGYATYLALLAAGPEGLEHAAWARLVLHSFEAFRVLCAVREGEWGVSGINAAIEHALEQGGYLRRAQWYVGRPVIVTRNDYGTKVVNGDIGLTLRDPDRPGSLRVYFLEGDGVRSVLATRLRHVETAFAMTVHKAQGSEFQHTVLVLPKEGASMLARELVYTGITRAREYFTLLTPSSSVLIDAIARRTRRASGLRGLLE